MSAPRHQRTAANVVPLFPPRPRAAQQRAGTIAAINARACANARHRAELARWPVAPAPRPAIARHSRALALLAAVLLALGAWLAWGAFG